MHRPLDTDSIPEFHAARLLILLATCSQGSPRRIAGRTKLAKLDFFLRYPAFLQRALAATAMGASPVTYRAPGNESEAPMIRYRYGPWDPRYGDFLALLEARGLIRVTGTRVDQIALTGLGRQMASRLSNRNEFADLVARGEALAERLASWNGTALKDLIYELFPSEVGDRRLREPIEP
ncbi:MAG: hypothetical protein ACRDLL_01245 [Solirubrobacterales bacterium]